MGKGYLQDLAIMVVSTARRGIARKRWKTTRRRALECDQYRCRRDELAPGIGAGHVTRFGPSFVHMPGSAPRPAPAGIHGIRPQLPETGSTLGPTRATSWRWAAALRFSRAKASSSISTRHNLSSQNSSGRNSLRSESALRRKLGRHRCALLATGSAAGAGAYTTPDVAA